MEINNVVICGLGALGLTYAYKLKNNVNLKILADAERIKKYKTNIPNFNGNFIELEYILPSEKYNADLIIISTKSNCLYSVLNNIKNLVTKNTMIISLINGISSEEMIKKMYPEAQVICSYYIGHSAIRKENFVTHDGIGKIVIEPNEFLEQFFIKNNIIYEKSSNIIYSQWVKLGVNVVLNQLSAINKMCVGKLKKTQDYLHISSMLIDEIKIVAGFHGIKNLSNYEKDVMDSINLVSDDGITSMLQDIISNKRTEVDIFSGEILRLAKLYGVKTPYNEKIYCKIKDIEKDFL